MSFNFEGGEGGCGRPLEGEGGRYITVLMLFRNNRPLPTILSRKNEVANICASYAHWDLTSVVPNIKKWPYCAVSGESILIRLNDSLGYRKNVFMGYKPKKAGVLITEAKLSQKLNLIKTRKLTV